jgi:hypothetical protein
VSYPGLEIIAKLAKALDVEPAELFFRPRRTIAQTKAEARAELDRPTREY